MTHHYFRLIVFFVIEIVVCSFEATKRNSFTYTTIGSNIFSEQWSKDTCPCYKKPGSSGCLTFDRRLQASTVEDAILNFPDLTRHDFDTFSQKDFTPSKKHEKSGITSVNTGDKNYRSHHAPASRTGPHISGLCQDEECRFCTKLLLDQLVTSGLINNSDAENLGHKFNVNQTGSISACSRYNVPLVKQPISTNGQQNVQSSTTKSTQQNDRYTFADTISRMINNLTNLGQNSWNENSENAKNEQSKMSKKAKRNAKSTDPDGTVGVRHKIGCVKRGDPVEKESEWADLCNSCWMWRKLPSDYFPSYINEIVCDDDNKCLSGWGTCHQSYKSIDVLQNVGTGGKETWRPITLQASSHCNCAVKIGSALHNFISA